MTSDIPAARTVRAAVVQSAPVLFDTPQTLDKLADLTADAARQRAELVVFPEAFVGGYPKGTRLRRQPGPPHARGARRLPPLLRERHRRARTGDRADRVGR